MFGRGKAICRILQGTADRPPRSRSGLLVQSVERQAGRPLPRSRDRLSFGPSTTVVPAFFLSLVFSACLMAFAVGTPGHALLACISLVPLFAAIRMQTPRRAMLSGALWGASLFVFLGLATPSPISITAQSLLLLGAVTGVYAYLGALLTRRIGFAATGPPIAGTIFCANAEGTALGLTNAMTQGFQTHNRFEGFDATKLTIVETECPGDTPVIIPLLGKGITLEPVPTVSEWGLIVMTLLLLAGAKVLLGRRTAVPRA